MATPISGNGALDTSGVEVDGTGQNRYVRAKFHNTNTTTKRRVTVRVGTAYASGRTVDEFVLEAAGTGTATAEGSTREFGPIALASGTKLFAAQDTGTDVNYAVTGEY